MSGLHDNIAAALRHVITERQPRWASDDVQGLVAAGEFDKAANYIQSAVLGYLCPIIADDHLHGPKGECSEPEVCEALIQRDSRAAQLIERVAAACPVCHGDGWTVEGDNDDPTGPGVQVPCWDAEHAVILGGAGCMKPEEDVQLEVCSPGCCEGCEDCLGLGLGCHNRPASRLMAEVRRLAELGTADSGDTDRAAR